MELLSPLGLFDISAVVIFFASWLGYTRLAKRLAKKKQCLANVMHGYRWDWMRQLLEREHPIADTGIIATLERNTSFFAYACMFLLAGLFALVGASEKVASTVNLIPGAAPTNETTVIIKLILLIIIFTYGFFTFTWGMRQYGFVSILIGGAPSPNDDRMSAVDKREYADTAASVVDLAGRQFNYGLRCYYFALAALSWFYSPWALLLMTALVVSILYRREFRSQTLKALIKARANRDFR